jgi:hypothetical protein
VKAPRWATSENVWIGAGGLVVLALIVMAILDGTGVV